MDATDRIVEEFDRLVGLGLERLPTCSYSERVVFYVVSTCCEIDINGFASVFEQLLGDAELRLLIDGLERLGEPKLAAVFRRGMELLQAEGFYGHRNWNKVSESVREQVEMLREGVGQRLWDLDEKLVAMLEAERSGGGGRGGRDAG